LRVGVAGQVDGELLEGRVALELLVDLEDDRGLFRCDRLAGRDEDQLLAKGVVFQRDRLVEDRGGGRGTQEEGCGGGGGRGRGRAGRGGGRGVGFVLDGGSDPVLLRRPPGGGGAPGRPHATKTTRREPRPPITRAGIACRVRAG